MLKVLILLACLVASTLCQYVTGDMYGGYPGQYMNGGGLRSVLQRRRFSRWGRRDYDSDIGYGDNLYGNRWNRDLDSDMDNQRYLDGMGY